MSSTSFAPLRGPIIVRGRVVGPLRSREVRLAVDTGATSSLIHLPLLIDLGLDPVRDGLPIQITTPNSEQRATKVGLTLLTVLNQVRVGFAVVAHPLPPGAIIDGLLGLDFFQGHVLTLDFRAGTLTLG